MAEYRLFFSWQNDRKDTKAIINSALKKAKNKLKADGIDLFIDQDTRERVGKRNIDAEVLEKIRKCDIFVADLTPVITYIPPKEQHDLPKHMPNSNVMYEYGYALHAKGENRMIVLASLDKESNEHIEYMPFDINHDTITCFKDENSLRGLYDWIKKIIEDVDRERAAFVPEYACGLWFVDEVGELTDSITIHPRYKRIWYNPKTPNKEPSPHTTQPSVMEQAMNPFNIQKALIEELRRTVPSSMVTVKPISKTTNFSYVPIRLVFINQGNAPLDNVRITAKASDERILYAEENVKEGFRMPRVKHETDTFADEDGIFQKLPTLNPQSQCQLDEVYIHAPHDIGEFKLEWKLSSRTYQCSGELTIKVEPEYEYDTAESDEKAGTERVVDVELSE